MSDRKFWIFLIFLFSGIIIGGLLGELAKSVSWLSWLGYGESFGLTEPLVLDIAILQLTFSVMIHLNVASIIGLAIAVFIYKKV